MKETTFNESKRDHKRTIIADLIEERDGEQEIRQIASVCEIKYNSHPRRWH